MSGAAGLSELIGGPGSREASQVLGTIGHNWRNFKCCWIRNETTKKKGKGLLRDKKAKSAGKYAIDKGADYAKGKIEGLGMLRKASPQQLASLAKARTMIGMHCVIPINPPA